MGQLLSDSLSPIIQNAAFAASNINAVYVAFPIAPERHLELIKNLAWAGINGFNLTMPYKQTIIPLLNELTPEAKQVQAVNTVLCQHKENQLHLKGHNTDGMGLLNALQEAWGWQSRNKKVLLLGAGGAARSIAFSILKDGCSHLWIANRTLVKAARLIADLQAHFNNHLAPAWHSATPPSLQAILLNAPIPLSPDLLIQATNVGSDAQQAPLSLHELNVKEAVVDIIYTPLETPLLKQAKKLGLKNLNGLGMLLHQGAHAFHFWTKQKAPLLAMRQSMQAALKNRTSS